MTPRVPSRACLIYMFQLGGGGEVFDSDIKHPGHLGHLLFTPYIRTFALSFGYAILGFSSSHRQHIHLCIL